MYVHCYDVVTCISKLLSVYMLHVSVCVTAIKDTAY